MMKFSSLSITCMVLFAFAMGCDRSEPEATGPTQANEAPSAEAVEAAEPTRPVEPARPAEPPTKNAAAPTEAQAAGPNDVEIALADKGDATTNNYCIDIAGGNRNVDPSRGLQAHTCYSYRGELGSDQVFDSSRFASNALYMPRFDVCATVASVADGAAVGLEACDGGDRQALAFGEDGRIRHVSAQELCLTAGSDTRFGRSQTHQIKTLHLASCDASQDGLQIWRARREMD